ncbi:hypothetical protein [Micromonospora sp. NPDC004704]
MDELGWYVIVEENLSHGDYRNWRVSEVKPAGHDLVAARAVAMNTARQHVPTHPMSPRRRQIFAVSEENLLVIVTGRTTSFQFRVSLARLVHDEPERTIAVW